MSFCIWLYGLSSAGKSTLARSLHVLHSASVVLDSDDVRRGLSSDLGFTERDRREHVRRLAESARLVTDSAIGCIVACITPSKQLRDLARSLLVGRHLLMVHVRTPLEVCMMRDSSGIYDLHARGIAKNVPGLDDSFSYDDSGAAIPGHGIIPMHAAQEVLSWL